ncbi:MAG: heat-inducible transcription repressor HrcA [Gammaproteobacteria bacterium]|nr:heat-inducible transcription repressor HrcA [Gammaproteobacteria bacterium]
MDGQISPRSQHILKVLIESYIRDGQPVGSKQLAGGSGLDLSSSTVRNVLADLEARGLVRAPHTSAGRVPTSRGYRVFVDSLLTVQPVTSDNVRQIAQRLAPGASLKQIAATVSSALSGLTSMAGLVMVPGGMPQRLRHIEFLSLSGNQVLVILVINDREVQNLIIETPRRYSEAELTQAANYLNQQFAGQTLSGVRSRLLHELRQAREQMDSLMQSAITMAERVFEPDEVIDKARDCVIAGQTNLMGFDELSDVARLRGLFEAFHQKREVLSLLDRAAYDGQGVRIFIGEESGHDLFSDCSLVTSTYQVDGEVLGLVGIIGPTRMAYDQVIPIVDVTARLVSAALNPADQPL